MCHPPTHSAFVAALRGRACLSGFLVAFFAALVAGCAGPGPYRLGHTAADRVVEPRSAEQDYRIGYVELDEQGWLWGQPDSDRYRNSQLLQVQHLVTRESRLAAGQKTAHGIILVAFVHGWKNNADLDNENVRDFKSILARLAADQRALPEAERRPVVGVFIAWPGLSATVEPFKEMSFYSRKNAADRVGYYGGVTEILCVLEKLHRSINDSLAPGAPKSCFVTVGHSFGAQVVYDAVGHILMQRLVEGRVAYDVKYARTHRLVAPEDAAAPARQSVVDGSLVKPFGDLVLLINPAFEAERYENIWRLSQQFRYPAEQRPVFAIFSSEGDWATHTFFPIGRYISTVWERYRSDSLHDEQRRANHHTIPWVDLYVTHYLRRSGEAPRPEEPRPSGAFQQKPSDQTPAQWLQTVMRDWNDDSRAGTLNLADCYLQPVRPAPDQWSPFYVVRVRTSLMKDHSDIWETGIKDFLVQFISAANPPNEDPKAASAAAAL